MTDDPAIIVGKKSGMAPWPRYLRNFPIIMIAVVQEFIWAGCILWDKTALNVTTVSILAKFFGWPWIVFILIATGGIAACGFLMKHRINTLLALLPQQFILYLSAGGAVEAITEGQFADGVERSQAFLMADQSAAFLIAFFHTWAMFLILRYATAGRHGQ